MKKVLIEVCCGSYDDAIEAAKAGADRIELNSSMFLGGLTPSIGTIREARNSIQIPIIVMVRPRGGGFCYTEGEFRVMEQDIVAAIESGADGIAFGVLNADGTVDMQRNRRLIKLIGDKEAVFHRAFDVVPDPLGALEQLVELGVKRVLTKGQENTIEEGGWLLKKLIEQAAGRIEILPGGCRPYNYERIVTELGCNQVHLASFVSRIDSSTAARPHVYFGSALRAPEDCYELANFNYLSTMKDKIDAIG